MSEPSSQWQTETLTRTYLDGVRGAIPLAQAQIDVLLHVVEAWCASFFLPPADVTGKTAGELCVQLAKGEKIAAPATYMAGGVEIPLQPIEDFNVTKENLVAYLEQYSPGYVDAKAVFAGMPKELLPPGAEKFL